MSKQNQNNYFDLLNINQDFIIDLSVLENNYFELQKQYHPDSIIGNSNISDEENLQKFQKSMLINDAYNIIKNDVSRAEYILSLHNISIDSEKEHAVKVPKNIVFEMIEIREKIDELQDSSIKLNEIKEQIKIASQECINKINFYYQNADFYNMAIETIRLKYYSKIQKDICLF